MVRHLPDPAALPQGRGALIRGGSEARRSIPHPGPRPPSSASARTRRRLVLRRALARLKPRWASTPPPLPYALDA